MKSRSTEKIARENFLSRTLLWISSAIWIVIWFVIGLSLVPGFSLELLR